MTNLERVEKVLELASIMPKAYRHENELPRTIIEKLIRVKLINPESELLKDDIGTSGNDHENKRINNKNERQLLKRTETIY